MLRGAVASRSSVRMPTCLGAEVEQCPRALLAQLREQGSGDVQRTVEVGFEDVFNLLLP